MSYDLPNPYDDVSSEIMRRITVFLRKFCRMTDKHIVPHTYELEKQICKEGEEKKEEE